MVLTSGHGNLRDARTMFHATKYHISQWQHQTFPYISRYFKKNFRRPEVQILPLTLQQSTKRRKCMTYKDMFLLCLNIIIAYIKNFYVVTFRIFCHFILCFKNYLAFLPQ